MSPKEVSTSVRGIGVAVITSTSTASPLAASARRWCTPKRCCSSTTAQREIAERHALLEQGMGADHEVDSTRRSSRASTGGALGAFLARR